MNIFRIPHVPLYISESDLLFLFDMVKGSSYVKGNEDYRKKSERTHLQFDKYNDQINAYADTDGENKYVICIFNGLCNASILMGIALAEFKQDGNVERLRDACRWIGTTSMDNHWEFTSIEIEKGIKEFNYSTGGIIGIEAKSYIAGAILTVIAHEQGHICLSHVVRGENGNEVSRNDERQADLFGCSVTATTPFASHIILASLFVEILLSWLGDDSGEATTHPHGKERVYNTLNSHEAVLRDLGITRDNIDGFLR